VITVKAQLDRVRHLSLEDDGRPAMSPLWKQQQGFA
jgi:hypothetical protein